MAKVKKKENLGKQIDRLYAYDLDIRKAEAATKEVRRFRAVLESKLLKRFGKDGIDGCKGSRGVARIAALKHPQIKNRSKLDKYIRRNKALDLLQNRINSKAYFDRLEEGERIPGVTVFEQFKVRVTKRGAK